MNFKQMQRGEVVKGISHRQMSLPVYHDVEMNDNGFPHGILRMRNKSWIWLPCLQVMRLKQERHTQIIKMRYRRQEYPAIQENIMIMWVLPWPVYFTTGLWCGFVQWNNNKIHAVVYLLLLYSLVLILHYSFVKHFQTVDPHLKTRIYRMLQKSGYTWHEYTY